MALRLEPNIAMPDDLYDELVALQAGLSDQDAMKAMARLILLLANHIGDEATLREAIRLARPPAEETR
jgi:hypothetical protein